MGKLVQPVLLGQYPQMYPLCPAHPVLQDAILLQEMHFALLAHLVNMRILLAHLIVRSALLVLSPTALDRQHVRNAL
jgi:hypothetical protein